MRETLTPGRLYARMSEDFRRRRRCAWCRLPLPELREVEEGEGANWALGSFANGCVPCQRLAHLIEHEYQERFAMHDPLGLSRDDRAPRRSPVPSAGAPGPGRPGRPPDHGARP